MKQRKEKTMLKKYKIKYTLDFGGRSGENKEIVIEAHSKEDAEKEFQDYDETINGDIEVEYVSSVEETKEPLSASYLSMCFEEERGNL